MELAWRRPRTGRLRNVSTLVPQSAHGCTAISTPPVPQRNNGEASPLLQFLAQDGSRWRVKAYRNTDCDQRLVLAKAKLVLFMLVVCSAAKRETARGRGGLS